MISLSLYYGGMAKVCATLRSRISKVADNRVNIMNSIIPGIRTVKMNAWEWPFFKRVKQLRRYVKARPSFNDNAQDVFFGAPASTFNSFGISMSCS